VATCAACGYEAADSFKFCPECGAPAARGREQRKVVTVLFCDVVGSTDLGESRDAEAVRALLAGFFKCVKTIVERHGGVVEKFIGDAVMAVFGLPAVHEDDALRALRAAAEIQAALPELGIRGRIGVNSGEVVTGTEERLATGDAVNVAARLQQAAQPDEILLGESTLKLAGDAVGTQPLEPLALKGKRESVPAWRLLAVSTDMPQRRLDAPLIGRERELETLVQAWEHVREGVGCELVTVVGSAGVGKSRLVEEFLANAGATIVRGRCLSYGEGVTYWPVVSVVKQLEPHRKAIELDPAAEDALAVLLGQSGTASTDGIAWGFRKLLEAVAAEGALVTVFDDIHWGEDVFLDLIEHVAFLSAGAPILLLCVARPELLDRRSGWGGVLRLEPLRPNEAEALMDIRLGSTELDPETHTRILQAAGGNPLFVEEMAAMIQASGDGEVEVPPTIQALLASRLDQLDGPERSVLERGAVEGELFHQGAVAALTPEESRLTSRLTALVRKEFVRPDQPQFAGTDAFRFRHLLIRDAAYDALPKADRAELHEHFADWLEEHAHDLVELDELVGYHLEQAYRYLEALGRVDQHAQELAARAGERLAAAGGRAVLRDDFRAGLNLLERSASLLPSDHRASRFEVDLGWARFSSGQTADALTGLAAAAERAARAGDHIEALALRVEKGNYDLLLGSPESAAQQRRLAEEALSIAEAAGDEWALTLAHAALVIVGELEGRPYAELVAATDRVLAHARKANDPLWAAWAESRVPSFQLAGDTPVDECLRWLDEHPLVERRSVLPLRERPLAMLGRFDEAHALLAGVADRAAELGSARHEMMLGWRRFDLARLEGNWAEAEAAARQACEAAEANAELVNYLWFCSMRAQALVELGRPDEAGECLDRGEELAASYEVDPQVRSRMVRARLLAGGGQLDEAERLAREAVARAGETDMLNLQGEALLNLAEVLALAGKEARPELEEAIALYERKGNLVMAERVRSQLAARA
jgi:class 3 adenylate cyclase/tetratricopeptide (TPR) repeat protein